MFGLEAEARRERRVRAHLYFSFSVSFFASVLFLLLSFSPSLHVSSFLLLFQERHTETFALL